MVGLATLVSAAPRALLAVAADSGVRGAGRAGQRRADPAFFPALRPDCRRSWGLPARWTTRASSRSISRPGSLRRRGRTAGGCAAIPGFNEVLFPGILTLAAGLGGDRLAWRRRPETIFPRYRARSLLYVAHRRHRLLVVVRARCRTVSAVLRDDPHLLFLRAPAAWASSSCCRWSCSRCRCSRRGSARTRPARLGRAVCRWLAAAELTAAPLTALRERRAVPRLYRTLATLPYGAVAEFPYLYRAQRLPPPCLLHAELGRPLAAAGQRLRRHIPEDFRRSVAHAQFVPHARGVPESSASAAPATWCSTLNMYDQRLRARLLVQLDAYSAYLRPIDRDGPVWLYEIVGWPN